MVTERTNAAQTGSPSASCGAYSLDRLVLADQLAAVLRSVRIAIPVNMMIGLIGTAIAAYAGRAVEALIWFAASTGINLVRLALCRFGASSITETGRPGHICCEPRRVDRQLQLATFTALISGIVWACLGGLCEGFTSAETVFYLAATCGITAGAITHGTAYARMPVCFITPPLLATAACFFWGGQFDRICLAICVLIYLAALARSAFQSEAAFREASRVKHEATALARSLAAPNERATEYAREMSLRATRDALTGLLNRAGFMSDVERQMADGSASCLMLLDLDGFKSVNDAFGHATGDRLLREVATRIGSASPAGSSVARLGGDEFAVFYMPSHDGEPPQRLAEGLKAAVTAPFEGLDAGRLGISIGIDQGSGARLADMLVRADEALYAAKAAGRNRHCLFDDSLLGRLEMRRAAERDLPRAIAGRGVEVWFQPIFGEGGRALSGFEALLRWNHPEHGWIAPHDVIAAATMAGVSQQLLQFIIEQAAAMLSVLAHRGREQVQVSVNVSPREIAQLPVDEIVLSTLAGLQVAANRLEVEITEDVALDIGAAREKLAKLSSAGVRLAVDDFGVGFSSLASLRQLRPDRVKIDRSFVTGMARSPEDQVLVKAILGLGRSMGFDVVAEGVETEDDLIMLRAAGCRLMQGYGLGRPMPARSALNWAERGGLAAA